MGAPPVKKARGRILQSLHLTMTELVIGLVALTTLAVWLPSYLNTRAAVAQLTDRLTDGVVRETVSQTGAHLAPAEPALALAGELLKGDPRYGVEPPIPGSSEPVWRARARLCVDIMTANPGFDMAYFGDEGGVWTGADRVNGKVQVDHRWIEGGRHFRRVFRVDNAGRWAPAPDQERTTDPLIRSYDPRKRPWYRQAAGTVRLVWTDPYVFAAPGNPPGITAALPLRRRDGALAGVVAVDFKLPVLSRFLASIRERGHEVFLLASAKGAGAYRVVAQPDGIPPASGRPGALELLEATRSPNEVLRSAAAELAGSGEPRTSLRFRAGGAAYLGATFPCAVGQDLTWTVLVVLPESQVLGVIQANTLWSSLFGAGIALFGAAAGAFFSARVARPLREFAKEMGQVGEFRISNDAAPASSIVEIDQMGRVLDRMKASLRAFQKYVPTDVVRLHLKTGQEAALGGETAHVTVMFGDIVGFTSLSEQMTPSELVDALAGYLEVMEEVVGLHEGLVDKYVGDCIVAFWGTPLRPHPEPERAACRAALEMQARFAALNAARAAAGKPPFELRIGLYTGEAMVGNIGSQRRMGYTAMGDSVNVASRLEGLTRQYQVRILIGETTRAAAGPEFETRFVDEVAVRGRVAPVPAYELCSRAGAERAAEPERQSEAV